LSKDFESKLNLIQLEKDKSDDRLKGFEQQREEMIKENTKLRALALETETIRIELDKEKDKNRQLHRKAQQLEVQLTSNTTIEGELSEMNIKLKSQISFLNQELQRAREQTQTARAEFEANKSELKSKLAIEKNELETQNRMILSKYNHLNSKVRAIKKFHDKKNQQYKVVSSAMRQKIQLVNGRMKELKLREKHSDQTVSIDAYNKLKYELESLKQKHHAFENVLNSNNNIQSYTSIPNTYSKTPPLLLNSLTQIENKSRINEPLESKRLVNYKFDTFLLSKLFLKYIFYNLAIKFRRYYESS
jgi:DNA repair exonuclease SbcCD ATPase subunit